ncbi:hypothetical protein ABCR94_03545 [Streptomyces sp. 21So2-11]|uniref:hypothetical protein n=1 Tax=Streptomyces sp. 21So2-11 TaxID=3144408 RepID=UPI003219B466
MATAGLFLCVATACSSSSDAADVEPSAKTSAKTSASPSVSAEDQEKKAVITAYLGYVETDAEAQRSGKVDQPRVQKYARDKAATEVTTMVYFNEKNGVLMKGKPRSDKLQVTALGMKADPRTATLSVCDDASDFLPVFKKNGKSALPKGSDEPARRPRSVKAVEVDGTWLISEFMTDRSRTC